MDESISLRFWRGLWVRGHREAKNWLKDRIRADQEVLYCVLWGRAFDNRRIPFSFQICRETLKTKLPHVFFWKRLLSSSSLQSAHWKARLSQEAWYWIYIQFVSIFLRVWLYYHLSRRNYVHNISIEKKVLCKMTCKTVWMRKHLLKSSQVDLLFASIPGLGRCPAEGNGNPLQYSCLENPTDKGAWRTVVYGVAEESNTT